jgi:hypothetical protein
MDVLYPIPDHIREEFNARKNDPQALQRPKTPWFRFISNAQPTSDGEQKEAVKILSGGTFDKGEESLRGGLGGQYSFERGDAARPEPGAESVSIEVKGSRIQITVNWKCWTPKQLEELAPYFLVPGMSCIIDFGWSTAPGRSVLDVADRSKRQELFQSGPSEGQPYRINPGSVENENLLHPFVRYERRGDSRYGIYVGTINNFDVSYNEQGGFDVSTKLLHHNEGMLQLRMRDQYRRREGVKKGDKKKPTFYEHVVKDGTLDKQINEDLDQGSTGGHLVQFGEETFMSWHYFEKKVLNPYVESVNRENPKIKFYHFDSRDSFASWYPNMLSTNEKKCITSGDNGSGNGLKVRGFKQKPSKDPTSTATDETVPSIPGGNKRLGYVYNMYINVGFLKDTAEQKENIMDTVETILRGCSDACFNIWDFSIEIEGNNLVVVDMNASPDDVDTAISKAYEFFPFTTDTVVQSFSFDFDLPKGLMSQMYIGSQTRETGSEKDGIYNNAKGTLQKLFGVDFVTDTVRDLKRAAPREEEPESGGKDSTQDRKSVTPLEKNLNEQFSNEQSLTQQPEDGVLRGSLRTGLDGYVFSDVGAELFKEQLLKDQDKNSPRNGTTPLPVNISLEFEGISGLRRFQTITVANLPRPFVDGVYMIKNVSHEISSDEWRTNVEANFVAPNPFSNDN